jgi:fructose-specific phosphotransferase system IIC component
MSTLLTVALDGPEPFHGVDKDIPFAVAACFLVALAIFVGTKISQKRGKKGTLPPIFWYFIAAGVGLIALFILLGLTYSCRPLR